MRGQLGKTHLYFRLRGLCISLYGGMNMALTQGDKPSVIPLDQNIDHRFVFLSSPFRKIGPHQAVEPDPVAF